MGLSIETDRSPSADLKEYDVDVNDSHHAERVKSVLEMPIEHAFAASVASPSESKTALELFRLHNSSANLAGGHMIEARVLHVDRRKITLDTGVKIAKIALSDITPECILSRAPDDGITRDLGEVRVGDTVQVYLEHEETPEGDMLVSGQQAAVRRRVRAVWRELQERLHDGKPIKGRILNAVAGGYAVGIAGLVCFLPNSMVTRGTARRIGELQQFKVAQMTASRNNVVLQDWQYHAWKAKPKVDWGRQRVAQEASKLLQDVDGGLKSYEAGPLVN